MKYKFLFLLFLSFFLLQSVETEYNLTKISFSGNQTFHQKILKKQIIHKTKSKLLFWKKKSKFNEIILEQDLENLKTFYQTEGFLKIQVEPSLKINEKKRSVELEFEIRENQPVLISDISYKIQSNDQSSEKTIERLIDTIQYNSQKNKRFRDNDLLSDKKNISTILINNGYPIHNIEYELSVDQSKDRVQIIFPISCEDELSFGDLQVEGCKNTKYIERQSAFRKGDAFDQRKLDKTQQQVMELGIFQFVTVKALLKDQNRNRIPIEILVKKAPKIKAKFGFGYGIEERFRVSADIEEIGFFRSIDKLNIYIKHSSLEPYHLNLKLTQPVILNRRNKLISELFLKKQVTDSYSIRRFGGSTRIQRQLFSRTNGFLGFSYERDFLKIEDDILEEESVLNIDHYNKANIFAGLSFDNSDSKFFPAKGLKLSSTGTLAGIGFDSDYHYYQLRLDGRKYQEIIDHLVIASRIMIGTMKPVWGDDHTPLEDRFYAGGANSIRGWRFSEIGSQSSENNAVGGNSYFESNLELRFPLWKIISGALFLDLGNVWANSYEYDFNDLHYSNGAGLRIKTPIGPIRFDIAKSINEQGNVQFYLSIGQAF